MKKTLLFVGGVIAGYALNTNTGKNLRSWLYLKGQEQVNKLVGKINEVTETTTENTTSEKSEEK